MDTNFILNSSSWDYANLAKSAANYGGPEKFVDAIHNTGRAADVANARLLGATVGVIVGSTVGIIVYVGVLKRLSLKRKTKIDDLFLQEKKAIDKNFGIEKKNSNSLCVKTTTDIPS